MQKALRIRARLSLVDKRFEPLARRSQPFARRSQPLARRSQPLARRSQLSNLELIADMEKIIRIEVA